MRRYRRAKNAGDAHMQKNTGYRHISVTTGRFFAASILVSSAALAAGADGPSAPSSASDQLQEITVTGHYEFLSADTSGTTNLPLPIEKVPQSISLVGEDFIKAADLKTIGDIADYVPGLFNNGPRGGFESLVTLRGFTPIRSIDGINIGAAGAPAWEPDYAIFDRVEVVKGPSSVVYGVSSAGGLINYVTKSATPQTTDYVTAQIGSWNSYRVEGQVAGSLDSSGRVRAIGVAVYDQGDSYVDVLNHKKTSLYGGINADLNSSVTVYLHGGHEEWVRTASDGLSTYPDGVYPQTVSRSFFLGSESDNFTTIANHGEAGLKWQATDMLDFNLKANYAKTDTSGIDPFSYGLQNNGDLTLNKQDINFRDTRDYGVSLSSIYKFDELGLKNSFVSVGALYQNSEYRYEFSGFNQPNGDSSATGNIFQGEAALTSIFNSFTVPGSVEYDEAEYLKTLTISTQSVLQVVDSVAVLLGASYSKPEVISSTFGVGENFSPTPQISYRGGVTYEFEPGTTAYLSYSQSFLPQLDLTVNNKVLPPLIGEQYEGGVKYRSPNGRLLLTGSLFQITEQNQAEFAELIGPVEYFTAAGEVKHRGAELEALGQISTQWQINLSYAYLHPEIIKNPAEPATVGQIEPFIPEQTASLFSTYTLSPKILGGVVTLGGGVRYVGPQRTNIPNNSTVDIPGYGLVDATAAYAINQWSVQLNARNIFSKFYYYNDYSTLSFSNLVGPPAGVTLTVRRNF
jgi:TonB-dependent siderophore receptor